jgi:ABC-type dipeptide/oligopeptide/nickel transport system permease component
LLEGVVLLIGAIYAFCNLAADLSYAALDPRVRMT